MFCCVICSHYGYLVNCICPTFGPSCCFHVNIPVGVVSPFSGSHYLFVLLYLCRLSVVPVMSGVLFLLWVSLCHVVYCCFCFLLACLCFVLFGWIGGYFFIFFLSIFSVMCFWFSYAFICVVYVLILLILLVLHLLFCCCVVGFSPNQEPQDSARCHRTVPGTTGPCQVPQDGLCVFCRLT